MKCSARAAVAAMLLVVVGCGRGEPYAVVYEDGVRVERPGNTRAWRVIYFYGADGHLVDIESGWSGPR